MDAANDAVESVPKAPALTAPPTRLAGALVVTALLFLPTGLVAVLFAWRARTLIQRGDMERARTFSRAAMVAIIVTIVIGVLVYAALIGALLGLGAFSAGD
ncbi:MAG TPA: CD225/dispanin family protein [Candidatus Nanopelagicales bacterium]|nr:CD225/dispanin family protein [Candidatus Nanopelagicales bacterium]